MGAKSSIEWTDATWNPWQGCTKVSPACEHCYMFTDLKRYGRDGSIVVRSKPPTFRLPIKRDKNLALVIPPGSKVFTCSWSDFFHKSADAWRWEAWAIIRQRPDLTFQIVTKRTDRIAGCLPADWGDGWPNVWLIATVENQEWADRRIPELLSVPAAVHGLSCEPLLGPVKVPLCLRCINCRHVGLRSSFYATRNGCCPNCGSDHDFLILSIKWVIAGGETGPGARPMNPEWVYNLRDECRYARVPFFFKQWGDWEPGYSSGGYPIQGQYSGRRFDVSDDLLLGQTFGNVHCWQATDQEGSFVGSIRVGKKVAGRLIDGVEYSQFPVTNEVSA